MRNLMLGFILFTFLITMTSTPYAQTPSFLGNTKNIKSGAKPTAQDYLQSVDQAEKANQKMQQQHSASSVPNPNSAILPPAQQKAQEKSIYTQPGQVQTQPGQVQTQPVQAQPQSQPSQPQVQPQLSQPQNQTQPMQPMAPMDQTLPFATGGTSPSMNSLPPPGTPPNPGQAQPGQSNYYTGFSGTGANTGPGKAGGAQQPASGGWGIRY